jgi:hypothetical protein
MNKRFSWRKLNIAALLIMVMVITLCLPVRVSARGLIDVNQAGDLTLIFRSNEAENLDNIIPITGVQIKIYKVADISSTGEFTLFNTYSNISNFPVKDINRINDQQTWKQVASVIGGFIYQNNVWPSATLTTDDEGSAHFTGIDLGLYYVGPVTKEANDCLYSFDPFMISVPGLDENDEWVNPAYYVVGTVKCKITYEPDIEYFEVLKNWNDSGYENYRPASIQVTIYCDGNEYAIVTLDSSNNWRYTWEYEEGHEWTLAETVSGTYAYTTSLTVS